MKLGETARGLALLDEALLAARARDVNAAWAGNIFCHLIEAAEELGDIPHARRWTDALTQWLAAMPTAVVFSGICRVHRSRVQQLTGAWDEAEHEAARMRRARRAARRCHREGALPGRRDPAPARRPCGLAARSSKAGLH